MKNISEAREENRPPRMADSAAPGEPAAAPGEAPSEGTASTPVLSGVGRALAMCAEADECPAIGGVALVPLDTHLFKHGMRPAARDYRASTPYATAGMARVARAPFEDYVQQVDAFAKRDAALRSMAVWVDVPPYKGRLLGAGDSALHRAVARLCEIRYAECGGSVAPEALVVESLRGATEGGETAAGTFVARGATPDAAALAAADTLMRLGALHETRFLKLLTGEPRAGMAPEPAPESAPAPAQGDTDILVCYEFYLEPRASFAMPKQTLQQRVARALALYGSKIVVHEAAPPDAPTAQGWRTGTIAMSTVVGRAWTASSTGFAGCLASVIRSTCKDAGEVAFIVRHNAHGDDDPQGCRATWRYT